ncbi:MAG TPA: insulinase family protein [Gemmatimonadaceae bacterium]|nr:insulinase family protein [Gemmatimonadaceae bacterium]
MTSQPDRFCAFALFAAAAALISLSPSSTSSAQQPPVASQAVDGPLPFDPAVTVGVLPNGMRYYIRENHKPEKRAELRLVVNAGSVLEDDDQRGLAHMVEHMAFRGTKRFARNEISSYLESVGMRYGPDINAFTSFDETVYMVTIPTDTAAIVDKGFQILSEWAHNVAFEPSQIEKERPVVIEEWRLGQGAENRMQNKWFPVLFSGSRYGSRLPIGDKTVLETYKPATLRRFYDTWYRPDLMAVVAVGDFNKHQIEMLIKRYLGAIPRSSNPKARTLFPVPPHDSTLVSITSDKEATRSVIRLLYKQPKRLNVTTASYRQRLVEGLFSAMFNDRFSEITQKPNPPFINAYAGQGDLVRSAESFSLNAIVADNGIPRGLNAVLTEGERVKRFGFLKSELDRAKKDLQRGAEQSYAEREKTNSDVYAGSYVSAFLKSEPSTSIEYDLAAITRLLPTITLAEVNSLAGKWMTDRNRVVATTSPDKPGIINPTRAEILLAFDAVRRADIAAYTETAPSQSLVDKDPIGGRVVTERQIKEIGVTEWTLSNGVRVLLKPTDFNADQISFTAYSPGGASLLSDAAYAAASAADLIPMTSGVGKFSVVDLQKFLAGKQVSVAPTIDDLSEGFSGSASQRDVDTMLQLVYLYFTQPRLDTALVNTFIGRYRGVLVNRSASPEAAFSDTLQVTMAQHSIREMPLTSSTLDRIDPFKSYDFYKDRFSNASGFTFVLVGNLKPDSIKPLIEKWLGALPSTGKKETWRDTGVRPPAGVVQRVVKKGTEPKARTALVFTGPFEYTRQNRYHLSALSELLNIKLREALRENLGGTYGVSVNSGASREPTPAYRFTIGFGSAPERLEALTAAALAQIDSVKKFGTTPEYLTKVKEAAFRSRETALKQNGYWLSQIASFDQSGWPLADIPNGDKLISSLTVQDLQRAAAKYLRNDNYVRVSLYPENYPAAENK